MNQPSDDLKMYEDTDEVAAFRKFAEEELQKVPEEKISEKDEFALRNLRIEANEFEYKLLQKQLELLVNRKPGNTPGWSDLYNYMELLQGTYKSEFIRLRLFQ